MIEAITSARSVNRIRDCSLQRSLTFTQVTVPIKPGTIPPPIIVAIAKTTIGISTPLGSSGVVL